MLVILLTVLLDAVGIGLIMPILPALLRSLGGLDAGSLHYGALLAAYALMQFLFSPILGALAIVSAGGRCCSSRSPARRPTIC